MVYPLVAIPGWVAGRYFYDFIGKATAYLLLPLLLAYALYRVATYLLLFPGGLPRIHEIFLDIGIFGVFIGALFGVLSLVVRHAVRRTVRTMSPDGSRRETQHPSPAEASRQKVREILAGEARAPMFPSLDPSTVDVFVSGHTHLPSPEEVGRPVGRRRVAVNSGCYLRQLHPVKPRLKGPAGLRIAVRAHPRAGLRGRWRPTRGVVGAAQTRAPEPGPRRTPALLWSQATPAPGGRRGPRAGTI